MPMYQSKPFEARLACGDNNVDIAQWCGIPEEYIDTGTYYTEDGDEYTEVTMELSFVEIG
ncbi:MAG: hypothetical protein IMZ61_01210 [Planctomycetes bacterium]|nr:hypothetical protein [Planctomycetota bacterium]